MKMKFHFFPTLALFFLLAACGEKVAELTVQEWDDEIETDQAGAMKKYGSGKIELTGFVFSIQRVSIGHERYTTVGLVDKPGSNNVIWLIPTDQAIWRRMTEGHPVIMRGKATDDPMLNRGTLIDAEVIKYEGPSTPAFTPQTLTERLRKEPDFGNAPVLGKLIVMKAEIESIPKADVPELRQPFVFKNPGGPVLSCEFDVLMQVEKNLVAALKPGDTIEFLCSLWNGSTAEGISIHSPTRIDQ